MVLRKPYKFLIKHFRMIHFILAIISGYLLTKTNNIINFFNDYLNNNETLIGTGTVNEYFNNIMMFLILIILIGTISISVIMKIKEKNILFYIINIILYVAISSIYLYDKSLIQTLEIRVIDIRTIKLASDLTLICFFAQTLSTIILSIRAVGFNIKKFNFEKDIEFEINEKDNEEFEFDVDFDKNKIKRNIKANLRNIKYAYHENKFIVRIIAILILIVIAGSIYMNLEIFNKVYRKNEIINTGQLTFSLIDSYITTNDYRENKITNNYLVVTKIKIKSNIKDKITFENARVLLHIGKITYNPTSKYKNDLIDLGADIEKKDIDNDYKEYIIVFEIPKKYISKKMILNYNDVSGKKYNIKLDVKKIDEEKKEETSKLNDYIEINDDVVKNTKFKISKYEISDKIIAKYNFCETENYCYESYEYIVPTLKDNYEKTIMKIEGELTTNELSKKDFNDLSDYIEYYGEIRYKIDEQYKDMKTKIIEVIPIKSKEKNIYYFEIYEEIKNADEISLILNIRNKRYVYVLK